ncbi:MAG TPA: lipopolysaccharide biosynthesis protein [Lentimicrobium sp.]|nr:lipopolysaccharide biosynthesis protein [Bacteroidales bacterium]HLO89825.1 lipopolysaccharide biosynthesis protein [Lentimicrobium sp.]
MQLKEKTITALFWSFIDTIAGQGINIMAGIILARLLMPREFGLIGMVLVFFALSEAFINSGFTSALIRKKECTQSDYSTVFFFNLFAGIAFFGILFIGAPFISRFFNEPQLTAIVRVLGLVLIIDAATLIQRTILTRNLDFKTQARVSFIASAGSGVVAVAMAVNGLGVWSLVAQRLSRELIYSVCLFIWNRWKPQLVFSMKSFKELFGFGSKLLASSLIDNFYNNVYYLLIGRYFSAAQLGFFTKADEYNRMPSQNISGIVQRVSYPVLCSVQDDNERLVAVYRKFIRYTMFITFLFMMALAAMAEPMIITLIGEKWHNSVDYFRMLCFVGMFFPLHVLNLNIIQVKGRSDLFLKLEVIKKITAVPAIILGVIYGIKVMIIGMMVNTLLDFYLNNHWSRKMIGYSFMAQVRDILPSFVMAVFVSGIVYSLGLLLPYSHGVNLLILTLTGALLALVICESTGFKDYVYLRDIIMEKTGTSRIMQGMKVFGFRLVTLPVKASVMLFRSEGKRKK